jgi:VanZ family protein
MIWSFFWAAIIAFLYFIPGKDMPVTSIWDLFQIDKMGHLIVFALFVLMLKVGMKRQTRFNRLRQKSAQWSLLIAIPYGGILEWVQGTVSPDRTSDIMDFAANVAGCLLGIVIFRLIYGRAGR